VGPPNAAPLAPIQKPEAAPDAINEARPAAQSTVAQTAPANGKKKQKPAFYKDTESSNKHKKKKGAGKLNPF
jgi:outer membrane protein assembly factor BamD